MTILLVNYNTSHLLARLFAAIEARPGKSVAADHCRRQCIKRRLGGTLADKISRHRADREQNECGLRKGQQSGAATGARAICAAAEHGRLRFAGYTVENRGIHGRQSALRNSRRQACGGRWKAAAFLPLFSDAVQSFCRLEQAGAWLRRWFFPQTRLVDDLDWDHASVRECDWVPGCYYLIRRGVLDDIGFVRPAIFSLFRGS